MVTDHFWEESLKATDSTVTDNQTRNKQVKIHKNQKKKHLTTRLLISWWSAKFLKVTTSSRMRFMSHNWSATKQRLHLQSVAEISRHSVLSGGRIRQCETSYYWRLLMRYFYILDVFPPICNSANAWKAVTDRSDFKNEKLFLPQSQFIYLTIYALPTWTTRQQYHVMFRINLAAKLTMKLRVVNVTLNIRLLPPTKEEVNAFARVRLSVCLLARLLKNACMDWMKCCMSTDVDTWTNWLTSEPDPDYSLDAGTGLLSPI